MKMNVENKSMKALLKANGINCRCRFITKGSLRGVWRFYQPNSMWYGNTELQEKFKALGFTGLRGFEINNFSGNGGYFEVYLMHPLFNKRFFENLHPVK